ncbi:hypothetical protein FRB94_011279 [Tulasnella sp. JGI-2019a]|nr:hypothetical protein FRB94_011279 [Tulasnella sp. JGI-2019a]
MRLLNIAIFITAASTTSISAAPTSLHLPIIYSEALKRRSGKAGFTLLRDPDDEPNPGFFTKLWSNRSSRRQVGPSKNVSSNSHEDIGVTVDLEGGAGEKLVSNKEEARVRITGAQEELETAMKALIRAKAAVKAAKMNLKKAKNAIADKAELKAELKHAMEALEGAKTNVKATKYLWAKSGARGRAWDKALHDAGF